MENGLYFTELKKCDNDNGLKSYIEKYRNNLNHKINISDLNISAQSAKATISLIPNEENKDIKYSIDLDKIRSYIDDKKTDEESLISLYKKNVKNTIENTKNKKFPNNLPILIYSDISKKNINIKIFKNGSISMTGCKFFEDGVNVLKKLETFLLNYEELFTILDKNKFSIVNYETTMVNSNYKVNFRIDRSRLFSLLEEDYNYLFSSYDPSIYAAVKIGFYYNKNNDVQTGICKCNDSICTKRKSTSKKGTGDGYSNCKIITIAIFESGNIVITGGRNIEHAKEAYLYINKIIIKNINKIILINISNIINK